MGSCIEDTLKLVCDVGVANKEIIGLRLREWYSWLPIITYYYVEILSEVALYCVLLECVG